MSLRNALKATVAGCTPQQMQHATFNANAATDSATKAQPIALNPHESWVSGATDYATGVQQVKKTYATEAENGEKLQVAFTSTRNMQPGSVAPEPPADPNAWHELAKAYHQHHFACKTCIAAGRGSSYGLRCGVGAALWNSYETGGES